LSLISTLDCPQDRIQFELHSGHFVAGLAYQVTRDLQPDECVSKCRMETNCRSLNIDYQRGLCEYSARGMVEKSLKRSPKHNFFEKICLTSDTAAVACDVRDWAFERVRGKELVGIPHEKVLIREAKTRAQCQTACVDYPLFICRSAEWRQAEGQCRLSPYNRFSTADDRVKLEPSKGMSAEVDYLENNCAHGKFPNMSPKFISLDATICV